MSVNFAFVFPGQGSQKVGMLADVLEQPTVQATFAEASEVLGRDLVALTQPGAESDLNSTQWTQPVLLTASVALWRLWQERGGANPAALAGHSLGEYSALVCAGALPFAAAVQLVHQRGQFMAAAVPAGVGAMAAIIGLDDDKVRAACQEAAEGQVVSAVNFNSPGQVVIAGHTEAVERAISAAKAAGAKKAMNLPVSVPSHCALMEPAAQQLAVELAKVELKAPSIPVYQNVVATTEVDPERIRANLVSQLYSPVRWVETIEAMAATGVERFYECGPGKVLSGLNKRISRALTVAGLEKSSDLSEALDSNQA